MGERLDVRLADASSCWLIKSRWFRIEQSSTHTPLAPLDIPRDRRGKWFRGFRRRRQCRQVAAAGSRRSARGGSAGSGRAATGGAPVDPDSLSPAGVDARPLFR